MHQHWWINDPDCLLLRDKLHFSLDEIRGIATSKALSGGSFILSDDLNAVSSERLRVALQLLPPAPIAATAVDLLERETPELFRMQLRSNYAHQALVHAGDFDETDISALNTPAKPFDTIPRIHINPIEPNDDNTALTTPRTSGNESSVTFKEETIYPYVYSAASSPTNKFPHIVAPSTLTSETVGYNSQYGALSPPVSPTSHSSNNTITNTNNHAHFSRVTMGSLSLSLSRCNSPQRPALVNNQTNSNHAGGTNSLLHNTMFNMNSSGVPDSPRISRKHSFEKGLIMKAGSDINLLRKQRRKVKEILKEENAINEDDLLGEYTLFTACNWSEVPKKDHFVRLRQIFGAEYIAQLVARGVLFENMLRLQRAAAAQKARRENKNIPKGKILLLGSV